tara:strand:+ start:41 stop:199 length:159 start_codon:yes stop_codon:yes gene_type:complete
MIEFGLAIKSSLEVIFKTNQKNIIEAQEYFRKLKDLSEEEFNKLFIVIEIKK